MQAVIIIILILAILLVIFTLQNSVEITIDLFFWEIVDAPFVLVLLACVLLGYLIAAIYFTPRVWKLKREKNQLQKERNKLESEIQTRDFEEEENPEGIEFKDEDDEDRTFFKA
jgi:uncharacterized integral membrane protein